MNTSQTWGNRRSRGVDADGHLELQGGVVEGIAVPLYVMLGRDYGRYKRTSGA